MADSLGKDLLDVLTAGTWTTKPGFVQVTSSKQTLVGLARANKSNNSCFVLIPPNWNVEHVSGVRSEDRVFDFWLFYFDDDLDDASLQLAEDQLDDLETVLAAATPISGYTDMGTSGIQNLTNRHDKYFMHVGQITLTKHEASADLAGNALWLSNWLTDKWDTNIIALPTIESGMQRREHRPSTNYLVIREVGEDPPEYVDYNNKYMRTNERFSVELIATSPANLALMKVAFKRAMKEDYFGSALFMDVDAQTLVLLHMDDGSGTTCDNEEGTAAYDFTFGAGGAAPAWQAGGFLSDWALKFDSASDIIYNANLFSHATNYPIPANGSIEICVRKYGTYNAEEIFYKDGASVNERMYLSYLKFHIDHDGSGHSVSVNLSGIATTAYYKIMVTWGSRGMEYFLNGMLIGTDSYTGTFTEGTQDEFKIGHDGPGSGLHDHYADEFRVSTVQRGPYDELLFHEGIPPESQNVPSFTYIVEGRRELSLA